MLLLLSLVSLSYESCHRYVSFLRGNLTSSDMLEALFPDRLHGVVEQYSHHFSLLADT